MARIRISDLTSATLPVQTTSLVELSVVNGAAPSGYDSRKQTISNLPFLSTAGGSLSGSLSVTGNITASGSLRLNNNPNDTVGVSATATNICPPDSVGVSGIIQQTVAAGGRTYYRNNVHEFNNAAYTVNYATIGSTGLTVSGTITGNPGTGAGLFMTSASGTSCVAYYGISGGLQWAEGQLADGSWTIYQSGDKLKITSGGACSASSTWAVISDMRLKEASSIQEYPRGLQEILALNPIYYQWNGKGGVPADGEIHYGLAAQDVEEVLPELIREHEYVPPEGSDDEPMTIKTYSPTDIVFSLIGAVKEIVARLDKIEGALSTPKR